MKLTKEQSADMLKKAKPLIKWLNDNCDPHCNIHVENDRVTLSEDVSMRWTEEFIKD